MLPKILTHFAVVVSAFVRFAVAENRNAVSVAYAVPVVASVRLAAVVGENDNSALPMGSPVGI